MYIFGLEQKIKTRGESVSHLLEWSPIGGHCPGSNLSGTLVLPAVSEQWRLSGPHTQLWAKAFWRSAEDTFLLPIPELTQLLPASGPLRPLFSFPKEVLLPASQWLGPPAPVPGPQSRPGHTLQQPVHLPPLQAWFFPDFCVPLWSLSPGRARAAFSCSPLCSQSRISPSTQ